MNKYVWLFIISPVFSFAQIDADDRIKLMQLLEQRKAKFGVYYNSINTKSGIFGNTTKKDLQRSNDILLQIVKTDNDIFEGLNNILQTRNYEKTSMNYDFRNQDQQIKYYSHLSDTLAKQLDIYRDKSSAKNLTIKRYHFYNAALLFLVVLFIASNIFTFYYMRMRKAL